MDSSASPEDHASGFGLAVFGAALHTALFVTLFSSLVWYVPAAKRTFEEFGLALPWITVTVIRLSDWLAVYWWVMIPVLLLLPATDFALMLSLARGWFVPVLWIVAVALLLIAVGLLGVLAIELPMMKLQEGLAH